MKDSREHDGWIDLDGYGDAILSTEVRQVGDAGASSQNRESAPGGDRKRRFRWRITRVDGRDMTFASRTEPSDSTPTP